MKGIEVALVGKLGSDAQLRTSSAGKEWMLLFVDVPEGDSEQRVNVSSWSHTIAELAPLLVKGADIYVEGKLKQRTWQNSDGSTGFGLSVSASLIQPLALIGNKKPKKPRGEKKAGAVGEASESYHKPLPFNDDIGF
jgi:single-strand DNA-binding protein